MRNTNNRIEKLKQKALNDPNSKIYRNYLKKLEEDKKLRERNITIPKIAFEKSMPPFVLDLLTLSDNILKQYGFIQ